MTVLLYALTLIVSATWSSILLHLEQQKKKKVYEEEGEGKDEEREGGREGREGRDEGSYLEGKICSAISTIMSGGQ